MTRLALIIITLLVMFAETGVYALGEAAHHIVISTVTYVLSWIVFCVTWTFVWPRLKS